MAVPLRVANHPPFVGAASLSPTLPLSKTNNCLMKPPKLRGFGGIARVRARRRLGSPMAALGGLLGSIFGTGIDTGEYTRQLYASSVALINQIESKISSLSDSQLRERTSALQQRARRGDSLDSLLPVAWFFTKEKLLK